MPPQPLAPAQPAQTGITDKDKTFDGSLNPLTEKIRAKYPGAYDDLDDASLTKMILAKHPQYEDLAAPKFDASPKAPGLTDQKAAFNGNEPITPLPGESFLDTMKRAAAAGKTVTPEQITGQTIQGAKDLPTVGAAAATAGIAGPAILAGTGELGAATPAIAKAIAEAAAAHPILTKIIVRGLEGTALGAGLKWSHLLGK